MPQGRAYDLVLFGATGFTGGLTAKYLAGALPAGASWALAGRNRGRLEAVRASLAVTDPGLGNLPLLVADSADPYSLREVAESTGVVITTVGPYVQLGDPLVAVCAAAGTDYVDLTGEARFVDETYVRHHATAEASGARLVHACGFESVPHDLGAYFTVQQLPPDAPISVRGVLRASGTVSGGTFHSAVGALSDLRAGSAAAKARQEIEPRPGSRRVHGDGGRIRRSKELGVWLVGLPTIDPQIVLRSARALPHYGPDFRYGHYAGVRHLTSVVGGGVALGAFAAGAHLPPLRRLMLAHVPQGEGPSEAKRARSWFSVTFLAEGGGQQVRTQVSGGDPGYGETAKMLAESAMCLAYDDNPSVAGQVTTAQAMGDRLTERLVAAGIHVGVTSKT